MSFSDRSASRCLPSRMARRRVDLVDEAMMSNGEMRINQMTNQASEDEAVLIEECQALGIWEAIKAVRELAFIVSQSREAHARIVKMRDDGSDFF